MKWILASLVTSVIGIVVLVACEGNVFSLKVGDCYNGPSANTEEHVEVKDVEVVRCDEPHESEVYAVFNLPDSSWKGDDYAFEQAEIGCMTRYEAFVGIEYYASTLYVDIIFPLEESWKMGDRQVQCSVLQDSYMKVTGSAKGKGNVYSLPHRLYKVGDCYNGPLTNTEESIDPVGFESVSCDEPHTNEVYAVFNLPDSSWKGEDYVFEQAGIVCMARFETFVGIEYDLSTLYNDILYPLEESWKMGDRQVQCSVTTESGMQVSGSAKGSRR